MASFLSYGVESEREGELAMMGRILHFLLLLLLVQIQHP